MRSMKKGITGDMLFWFMVLLIGAITVIVITMFVANASQSFDQPPGQNPLVQSSLFFWMIFKLRKPK